MTRREWEIEVVRMMLEDGFASPPQTGDPIEDAMETVLNYIKFLREDAKASFNEMFEDI